MERKLVTIQKVKEVLPIDGADAIELVKILGWQCVAKKGEFKEGDLAVYFEVDSFLPADDERYEFLRKSSYKQNPIMGEGLKIRSQKFRGALSQGLALPITLFPELDGCELDVDVSKKLGVKKWDMPEITGNAGTQIGKKPYGIPTTDETRVQSDDRLRTQLLGKPYYITTKMDGTSCTMYYINGRFGVCGRNYEYKDDDVSPMWKYARDHGIKERLDKYAELFGEGIVFQGEFCGPGIQKNRLQLKEPEWYVFNVFSVDENQNYELKDYNDFKKICSLLNLNTVPTEEIGEDFEYTLEELLEMAKGKYESRQHKEGIVVRPTTPEYCDELGKDLSFKVLNNDFLLKDK